INQNFRGRTFARAVFFLPVIIATGPVYAIITGDMSTNGSNEAAQFSTMFETDMVDQLLEFVGIYGFNDKFTEILTTLTADILNLVWNCGIQILIFLSALQNVSTSAKEAAMMEGATAWEFFWKITLPCVSPMILACLIYTIIDTFIDPTNKVMTLIVAKQTQWDFGLMSAMAWAYFAIVLVALGIIFLIIRNWIYYEVE
ncbi:MAG: ABC transporter permease subunit, partial [Ruminococcus sp.]|nr:ABC transporter permease subunit [Ruminococcus sp.]